MNITTKYLMKKRTIILFITLLAACIGYAQKSENDQKTKVFVMEIKQEIDARTNRYVELAMQKAEEIEADLVVIEMNTYGGAVYDANDIVSRLLGFEKPIYVYIDKNAASAGALISIACDSIFMAGGSSIGAATVVTMDGQAAPDKYQSYMRSTMRSTAEENGRDPNIAEAMVDENIEIEGISKAGQVLTFSTKEAIANGFCEAEVSGLKEILERSDIKDYEIERYKISATEKIISIFLNPFVSSILILVIVGGIYFELQTPGVGFPILAAFIAMVLYFIPYYLNGLAENWEIAIFFVGLALLALEVFVIPGFGVAGISGIGLIMASLVLSMLNNDNLDFSFVPSKAVFVAVATIIAGLLGGTALMFVAGVRLTNSHFFKRIALEDTLDSKDGFTSRMYKESLVGKQGTAFTILRPSGKIMIDDTLYDAFTRGSYIEKGVEVTVISDEGTSLKVRKA